MVKLLKYLKPFVIGFILVIILLFGQAMCDLNLPNYMSKIVNIGIQQSGLENGAPEAISEKGMKLMITFMTDSDRQLIAQNYLLVSVSEKNEQGQLYQTLYPQAEKQLYVRKSVDSQTLLNLNLAFGTSTWTLIKVLKEIQELSGKTLIDQQATNLREMDISLLYQAQPLLDKLSSSVIDSARKEALTIEESFRLQSGIFLAIALAKELGVDISKTQFNYIMKIGLLMLTISLLGGLATVLVSLLSSRIAAGASRNLRGDIFSKIESFSKAEFDKFSTASLITRCTNDILQIQQMLMMGIRMMFYAPIMAIGGVFMAIQKSSSMSWIIALACITILGLIVLVMTIAMPKFHLMQKLIDKLNLVSRESLSGVMVIRAFIRQDHEKKRFEEANKDLTKTSLFVNRVMVFLMPVMMLVMNCVILLIIWIGSHQIADAKMKVGDMMAFMQYAMQIIMSFLMISFMFIFVPRAAISAGRVSEILETKNSILDPPNPKNFISNHKGIVEFKNVHFRYEGAEEEALTDISFTAQPGQTTAIIGSTGSGKSTLISLILRFYDVSQGQVLVDGVDVREVKQKDLRSKIGYVPQKGILLSGTIASNIRYGKKEATDEEIKMALSVAQAADFVMEKPQGLDSDISQGGTNVSGGQKQRLSIARALVKEPEIFIFDDCFSALDFKTDSALRRSLKRHFQESTVIIVAQRVNTIMNADKIIVLDEGKIVGMGTHQELLESCPQYYEIATSQQVLEG